MEKATKEQKLRVLVHDIRGTIHLLENSFNGVIDSPSHKEDFRFIFVKALERVESVLEKIKHVSSEDYHE